MSKRKNLPLLAAVVVLALAPVAQGQTSAGVRTAELEAMLPTAVPVYCTDSDGSYAFADFPAGGIHLAGWVCELLLHGQPGDVYERLQMPWAIAVHTLYHEWWHVAFHEHDEKLTDCGAWSIFPYVLQRYWHLTAQEAQELFEVYGYRSAYAPLPCGPG
jgi:hypothetical protein